MTGMGGSGASPTLVVSTFQHALLRQGSLLLIVGLVLYLAWNVLRSAQYRRALAAEAAGVTARPVVVTDPEPPARRLLRIGFGALWIFDGMLQMQSSMPLGLPGNVLQPAASTSPGWVQDLSSFAVTEWTRHPVTAATATVWIQLGIGLFLLVAPRGGWSRVAGGTSVAWGLVVWIFANALGGLFAPGLTFLFGAPGAVLFYVVAGALLLLPERAWIGPVLGRYLTASLGAFLLVMGALQAWPGRGFWPSGHASSTLSAMSATMAATPQPNATASLVAWFTRVDTAHGGLVNAVVVVLLVGTGVSFLLGRALRPALAVLTVFCLFDWVFIENFGFLGGTGTDPNSMLPFLLLAWGSYVAVVRAPVAGEAAAAPVPAADAAADQRAWWERLPAGRAGRLAAMVGAVVVLLLGSAPLAAAALNSHADPLEAEVADGAPTTVSGPAPAFHLVDTSGRPVSLAGLRGSVVVLTFLDPVCVSDCPTIAQELRLANEQLGTEARRVVFVAVATNPQYHSADALRTFDRTEGLDGQPNWLFLTGTTSELEAVWNSYGIAAILSSNGAMVDHSDTVYVIDAGGSVRRIMSAAPGASSDVSRSSFAELLTEQVHQVLGS